MKTSQEFNVKLIAKREKNNGRVSHSELIGFIDEQLGKWNARVSEHVLNETGTVSATEWTAPLEKGKLLLLLNHTTTEPILPPRILIMFRRHDVDVPVLEFRTKSHTGDVWRDELKEEIFGAIKKTIIPKTIPKLCAEIKHMKEYKVTVMSKDNLLMQMARLNYESKGAHDRGMSWGRIGKVESRLGDVSQGDEMIPFITIAQAYTSVVQEGPITQRANELSKFWDVCRSKYVGKILRL